MVRCGCSSTRCSCRLESSDSVNVTGFGTQGAAYLLSIVPPIETLDTPTLSLILSQVEEGLRLSAYPRQAVQVDVFTEDATWSHTVPPGTSAIRRVLLIGGGGGGGGGMWSPASNLASRGGGGGAGGNVTYFTETLAAGAHSESVVIGAGGAGGAAPTSRGLNGLPGSDGAASYFGTWVAHGGPAGQGGAPSSGSGGVNTPYHGVVMGGDGSGAVTASKPDRGISRLAPGGGGGGGAYIPGTGVVHGDEGGYSLPARGLRTKTSPAPFNGTVADGEDDLVNFTGSGGAGGYNLAGTSGPRRHGGNGGAYGGGGGGGAQSNWAGIPPGNGGDGHPGICVVMVW